VSDLCSYGFRVQVRLTKIQCRGVLFDLDGVLVDSTPAVARCWRRWSLLHGFEPEEVIRRAHGRPSIATLRELLPNADHEAENQQMERWEIEDIGDVVALPGAIRLLQTLPAERWAIVTSCTRPLAEVRIRAGGLPWPKNLVTSADIQRGKPDPEPYVKGATQLGLAAEDCLVIEDAPAGIRSGKGAGARVLALRTTESDAELAAAGADWIIDNLGSVDLDTSGTGNHISLLLHGPADPQTP
jgi:mannitol-1-/sugar-/sorbitol-6-phosphatase